ncbi:asparagine synthase (glutamine-hydrolyzing) [soil metagenome]
MCGITGYLSFNKKFNRQDLEAMTHRLEHRGPDAEGLYNDEVCGLGHRRLSIIDLSDRANQPMTSSNGRYIIVYNGEVYNFREIGARLKENPGGQQSVKLKTSSDTEVILEAFCQYGSDFVQHLNGMFAIGIYDTELNEIYCFRDRLGIKPLIYYWDGENFAFASEMKSLLLLKDINKEINYPALHDFLHLGFIPAPDSIYKNIFKMQPGTWMKVSKKGLEISRYWNIRQKLTNNIIYDKEQALVKMSDLLMSSVQYQLKSDVPFGVFLSGGIDSSLVTAQAVSLSSVKVNTFSIGFEENSHNESEYARAIANYLGTNHHEFIVSYRDAMNLIDSFFDAYDEPFSDPSAIPTMLVSKLASQYVTVTLSGEGGDELFFGYGSYQWARRLSSPLYKVIRKPMALLFSQMSSRYQRIEQMLKYENSKNIRSHIFSQEQYFYTSNEIDKILNEPFKFSTTNDTNQIYNLASVLTEISGKQGLGVEERKLNAMEKQALFDIQYYLPDDLLTKVDRASMRFSIETRVPYLDHRVVEFAQNLSPDLKYHNGISKYILKEILYQYIPKRFFDRPKQGFAIPMNKWLRKELRYLIDENLNPEIIKKVGILNPEIVKEMVKEFLSGKDFLYNRIWLLIVLQHWFKKNQE